MHTEVPAAENETLMRRCVALPELGTVLEQRSISFTKTGLLMRLHRAANELNLQLQSLIYSNHSFAIVISSIFPTFLAILTVGKWRKT